MAAASAGLPENETCSPSKMTLSGADTMNGGGTAYESISFVMFGYRGELILGRVGVGSGLSLTGE